MSTKQLGVREAAARQEESTRPVRTFTPEVDICETPEALWLWANLPGVDEKSLEVELKDDVLRIEGHVALETYEALRPVYTEYSVGHYERRFRLGRAVDADRIRARMANGVLELELPKAERARPRRIEVAVG